MTSSSVAATAHGVFVSNINQAVGAFAAVRGLGLGIPADVSVVGYDDDPLADYMDAPLTTIRMPLAELGVAAIDALAEQIAGADPSDPRYPPRPSSSSAHRRRRPPDAQ